MRKRAGGGRGDEGRLERLAREVAAREAGRAQARERARRLAGKLHAAARSALARFVAAAREAGAPHLDLVRLSPVEPDDKSIRAFQFALRRGRWTALVVSKDRGEVMLVGPFKRGEDEGPCRPIHFEPGDRPLQKCLGPLEDLLVELLETACAK